MPWAQAWKWSFVLWPSVSAVFSLQAYVYMHGRGQHVPGGEFAALLLDFLIWAALTPAVVWYCWRRPATGAAWRRNLPWQIAGAFLGSAFFVLPFRVGRGLLSVALDMPDLAPPLTTSFAFKVAVNAFFNYVDIALVAHAIQYARESTEKATLSAQLETRLAEAQLQVLRLQLHPHFLFNTLHTISALMHKDLKAADGMLALLGDLLRDSLEKVGAQEVSLKQELGFLERYLQIERTRFRDRLSVVIDVDPETLDAEVPNLLLQPLVENSIRHGLEKRQGAGRIELVARRRDGRLEIRIRDDGPGLPEGSEVALRAGVGLANTQSRLQQLYGAGHRFDLRERAEGGLEVCLEFPFKLRPEPEPPALSVTPTGTAAALRAAPVVPLPPRFS